MFENVRPKPPGFKTVRQWEREGMMPIDEDAIEEYAAVDRFGNPVKNEFGDYCYYKYVSPDNVIPIESTLDANDMCIPCLDVSISPHKKRMIPYNFDLLSGDKKIICFDTETTGFSKWDEILQITISDETGELLNTFVKPVNHKTWKKASEVNGIYPEDVVSAPTAKVLRETVKKIFESADIIIGHNVSFDIRMVEQCFHIKFSNVLILDTLDLFKMDKPEGTHKLINAVEEYIPEQLDWFKNGAHKSDTDTKATLMVFFKLYEKIAEKFKQPELEM